MLALISTSSVKISDSHLPFLFMNHLHDLKYNSYFFIMNDDIDALSAITYEPPSSSILVRQLIGGYQVDMKEDAISSAATLRAREESVSVKPLQRACWRQKG